MIENFSRKNSQFMVSSDLHFVLIHVYYLLFRLDLDQWINDPPSESSDEERDRTNVFVDDHTK